MSIQGGTTLTMEALKYVTGLIRNLANISESIDDINLRTDGVWSSVHTNELINKCLQDANIHAEAICNALTKLTAQKTTIQPTLDNSEKNVIYLYSADGNSPFEQYLKISDTELIDMGSTTISLENYLTATQIANEYAKKVDFDTLTTEVTNIKTNIGTLNDLTTTDKTSIVNAINELKTDLTTHTTDTNIHVTTSDKAKWNEVDNKVDKTTFQSELDKKLDKTYVPIIPSSEPTNKVVGSIWLV